MEGSLLSVRFVVPGRPVPQRSSSQRKEDLLSLIRAETRGYDFLFSGDVEVLCEWYASEADRYESDASPDIDNILKPLIDGLCGPDGVLIDDCQVQHISIQWIDSTAPEELRVSVVPYQQDARLTKGGLVFVHLGRGICCPGHEATLQVDAVRQSLKRLKQLRNGEGEFAGLPSEVRLGLMPAQRFFRISRVKHFTVMELDDILRG